VRILDISVSGVLVLAGESAGEGARGLLRLDLAGQPFSADVAIQRVLPGSDGFKIGASFVNLDAEHRDMIERFTKR